MNKLTSFEDGNETQWNNANICGVSSRGTLGVASLGAVSQRLRYYVNTKVSFAGLGCKLTAGLCKAIARAVSHTTARLGYLPEGFAT